MARYSKKPLNPAKSASARGSYIRASFKNTFETANAIKGWNVKKALKLYEDVLAHKRAIPFRKHAGSIGRTGQGKEWNVTKARWPEKSVKYVVDLLKNAQANADVKGLDTDKLVVQHIQVNQAPKQRRRTYRAHGRANAYQASPSHVELILAEEEEKVEKAAESGSALLRLNRKQRAVYVANKKASDIKETTA